MSKESSYEIQGQRLICETDQRPGSWLWITERFQKASGRAKMITYLPWTCRILMCLDGIAKEPKSWNGTFIDPDICEYNHWALQSGFNNFNHMASNQSGNIKVNLKSFLDESKDTRIEELQDLRAVEAFFVYKLLAAKKWNSELHVGRDMWESEEAKPFRTSLIKWKKNLPAEFSLWNTAELEIPNTWSNFYACSNYVDGSSIFSPEQMKLVVEIRESLKTVKKTSKSRQQSRLDTRGAFEENHLDKLAQKLIKCAKSLEAQANDKRQFSKAEIDMRVAYQMLGEIYCNANNKEYCDLTTDGEKICEFLHQHFNVKVPSANNFEVRVSKTRKNTENGVEFENKTQHSHQEKRGRESELLSNTNNLLPYPSAGIKRKKLVVRRESIEEPNKQEPNEALHHAEMYVNLNANKKNARNGKTDPSKQLKKNEVKQSVTASQEKSQTTVNGNPSQIKPISISPTADAIGNNISSLTKEEERRERSRLLQKKRIQYLIDDINGNSSNEDRGHW